MRDVGSGCQAEHDLGLRTLGRARRYEHDPRQANWLAHDPWQKFFMRDEGSGIAASGFAFSYALTWKEKT